MKSLLLRTIRFFKNLLIFIVTLCVLPLGIYLMYKSRWSSGAKMFSATAAIGLAIFVMFGALLAPPHVTVTSINPNGTTKVQASKYVFSGKVQPASADVTVNGKAAELNKSGEFTVQLSLTEGVNTINLRAVDGTSVTTKTFTIEYTKPPETAAPAPQEPQPQAATLPATTQEPQPSEPAAQPVATIPAENRWYQVITVIDADTFKVKIDGLEQTINVIGIDAPETTNECYGKEAGAKAKELLLGKWVQLKADKLHDNTDTQGRLLRYVYLNSAYSDYGKRMLDGGYAYEYSVKNYQAQAAYKTTQQQSQSKARGLWAKQTCDGKRTKPSNASTQPTTSKSSCDPNYSPCIPNVTRSLDCSDIRIMVRIVGNDSHKLDTNGDGYACEEYR